MRPRKQISSVLSVPTLFFLAPRSACIASFIHSLFLANNLLSIRNVIFELWSTKCMKIETLIEEWYWDNKVIPEKTWFTRSLSLATSTDHLWWMINSSTIYRKSTEGAEIHWMHIYWVLVNMEARHILAHIPVGFHRLCRRLVTECVRRLHPEEQQKHQTWEKKKKKTSRGLARSGWAGWKSKSCGKVQIIQLHVSTTRSSQRRIIFGVENWLTHSFKKYLRAHYVPGVDLA